MSPTPEERDAMVVPESAPSPDADAARARVRELTAKIQAADPAPEIDHSWVSEVCRDLRSTLPTDASPSLPSDLTTPARECGCAKSDAWRCMVAGTGRGGRTFVCWCQCHKDPAPLSSPVQPSDAPFTVEANPGAAYDHVRVTAIPASSSPLKDACDAFDANFAARLAAGASSSPTPTPPDCVKHIGNWAEKCTPCQRVRDFVIARDGEWNIGPEAYGMVVGYIVEERRGAALEAVSVPTPPKNRDSGGIADHFAYMPEAVPIPPTSTKSENLNTSDSTCTETAHVEGPPPPRPIGTRTTRIAYQRPVASPDMTPEEFTKGANHGIIGIGPAPWTDSVSAWPTEGYDGALRRYEWEEKTPLRQTGHTKEEWCALADVMIARWAAWKAHIEAMQP